MTKQNMPRLTESQLFTIEALNKIQGFVWPKEATHASMDDASVLINFYAMEPVAGRFSFSGVCVYAPDPISGSDHPDWRNSLITREKFDRVDGWVRHTGQLIPHSADGYMVDYMMRSGVVWDNCHANNLIWQTSSHSDDIIKWRHHKPANEKAMPDAVNQFIDQLTIAWQKAKANADTSRAILQLAEKEEAEAREAVYGALHDALNLIGNKQSSIPTLTNEQCLKFLCTAFRHNEIKGDIEFDDINLGLRMALSREAN